MGMRGLGQIAELAAIGEPTIGVVTNVGKSHIELLGSQENIAKARANSSRPWMKRERLSSMVTIPLSAR